MLIGRIATLALLLTAYPHGVVGAGEEPAEPGSDAGNAPTAVPKTLEGQRSSTEEASQPDGSGGDEAELELEGLRVSGVVRVVTDPGGADVYLDHELVGKTPVSIPSVLADTPHAVRVEADDAGGAPAGHDDQAQQSRVSRRPEGGGDHARRRAPEHDR